MPPFVPSDCRRVLNVWCGAEIFDELLKQARQIEVRVVEPVFPQFAMVVWLMPDSGDLGKDQPENGI